VQKSYNNITDRLQTGYVIVTNTYGVRRQASGVRRQVN